MRIRVVLAVLALVTTAAPVFAQTTGEGIGGRVFAWGDWQQMTAKDSFDAVTGEEGLRHVPKARLPRTALSDNRRLQASALKLYR